LWEIPLAAGSGRFLDLHRLAAGVGYRGGGATGLLMRLRESLGWWFGWDKANGSLPIPGCTETSLAERLTDQDRRRNRAPEAAFPKDGVANLRSIYLFEDESLQEVSNKTIHALLHWSWMSSDPPTARLAIYVKHRGAASKLYMSVIKPFRYAIIYPAWTRKIQRAWEQRVARPSSVSVTGR
jgi:hypothetical protein